MKNKTLTFLSILILCYPIITSGQGTIELCNTFDTILTKLHIDTLGSWEIGQPTKTVFDNSYSGINSIVTDLTSPYPTNDTSRFYVFFFEEGTSIPSYLGGYEPLIIEFNHRFITDSITDHGEIEYSFDNGITWYDLLSSDHNADWGLNEHYFEDTGDTLFDSLAIFGNSNGWVHSIFTKNIEEIIYADGISPDSIILRFSFISDSIGGNDGWQIDNFCMSMDYSSGIFENQDLEELSIYPNPNNGEFLIPENSEVGELSIYNLLGNEVYSERISNNCVSTNLPNGIYIVSIKRANSVFTSRMIIR